MCQNGHLKEYSQLSLIRTRVIRTYTNSKCFARSPGAKTLCKNSYNWTFVIRTNFKSPWEFELERVDKTAKFAASFSLVFRTTRPLIVKFDVYNNNSLKFCYQQCQWKNIQTFLRNIKNPWKSPTFVYILPRGG